jgi:hypothetical protein
MSFIADAQKRVVTLISENASTILTAGGVVGTVTTAVLTGRAAAEATKRIADKYMEINVPLDAPNKAPEEIRDLKKTEKLQIAAPLFVPPIIVGSLTIGAIVMSNRISAQKAAALAAAYGASARQRDELRAKLEEKLGIKKSEQARGEIEEERTRHHDRELTDRAEMIIVSGGAVLCYDTFSDRYIRTTAEKIRNAEKKVKEAVDSVTECPLEIFYKTLGFDSTPYDDMLGWNTRNPPNVTIDTILVNDEPCLCIDFVSLPMPDWHQDYD